MNTNQHYQQWNEPSIKNNEFLHMDSTYFNNYQDQQLIQHKDSTDSTLQQFYSLPSGNISSQCKFHFQEQHNWSQQQGTIQNLQNYHNKINLEEGFENHNILSYNEGDLEEYAYEIQFISQERDQQKLQQIKTAIFETTPDICKKQSKSNDRKSRVERYFLKKARRCFIKKISYQCRKTVADKRVRIKGRFVKKSLVQSLDLNNSSDSLKVEATILIQFPKIN